MAAIHAAHQQLRELEKNADAVLAALGGPAPAGPVATLVTDGKRLAAALAAASEKLAPLLQEAATSPVQPSRKLADALWEEQQAGKSASAAPAALAQPPAQPAATLPDVLGSLHERLPDVRLSLLAGCHITQQAAEATAVHMRVGDALAAVVALEEPGSLRPLRAAVLSLAEAQLPLDCAWGVSQHAVFQRATATAAAALRHFAAGAAGGAVQQGPQGGPPGDGAGSPLELLLLWLATYSDLFTRPSSATGRLLAADARQAGLLPPSFRPYKLGWAQLWAAALDPTQRIAAHDACELAGKPAQGSDEL
eukprot:scaffold2.g7030.t1